MKYAMVDGQRREALPGLLGTCPICGVSMIRKCGTFRVPHWAHPPGSVDHQWEPETEWHRNWKGCFAVECQEVIHHASNGERHIADVKTQCGLVVEFQNSPISEEERRSREEFYRPMVWVVNGQRLKRDRPRFFGSLRCRIAMSTSRLTWSVPVERCVLLQKWAGSRVPVFFDFGRPVLWALDPRKPKGVAVLTPVYRKNFLEAVTKGEQIEGISLKVFVRRLSVPQVIPSRSHSWKPQSPGYKRYFGRKRRAWSRSGISVRRSLGWHDPWKR